MSDEVSQFLFEGRHTSFAVERFCKPEECKDDIGSCQREMFIRRAEIQRTRSKANFVSGEALVTHGQIQLRMHRVNLSFDVTEVLLAFGQ